MSISIKEDNLIYPYFIREGVNKKSAIKSFPGVYRFSIDKLLLDIEETRQLGIKKILLFGIPVKKSSDGAGAYAKNNVITAAIKKIKQEFNDIIVITDVCLCAYTTHGHCRVLKKDKKTPDNKKTLEALSKIALSHAEAGSDWVAPSAMAKNQVSAIRGTLNKNGFKDKKIMGYSAKFASNFYGPFRNAADSSPRFGDRRSYQLDFTDGESALKKIADDIKQGADMVMVKPALGYLDIIREARQRFDYPLAAYNVSGEYAFVKYGARQGLWDEKKMVFEILSSIRRAGADLIITYHAKDVAKWLKEQ
ncbi:MAG: porphobilinogen synthase [Candidatus Omnitrophota bacterium]|nr:porphobilinogen synthase [Candidatus Omnitrophota bacterium]